MQIFGVILITQLLTSCGETTTVDSVAKTKEVAGDFVKNIEVSSEKITLNMKEDLGSYKLVAKIAFKGISPCPGCTYDYVDLTLLDETNTVLGVIKFNRSEGDQIDRFNNLIQRGSGRTTITFTGGRIGDQMDEEDMKKIIESCKSFSVEAKALKIPTVGELLIGAVTIPDTNFKAYLVGNTAINTNGDKEIQVSEAAAFNGNIYCPSLNIADLTGIEAFTALTGIQCNDNQLTSLNVSQNTALLSLYCKNNQLTSLDVSQNTALNFLECDGNKFACKAFKNY